MGHSDVEDNASYSIFPPLSYRPMGLLSEAGHFLSQAAQATEPATPPEWWKVASGVVAVPAGILGLVYSWVLIRKTRLETTKTELEIREKQRLLAEATEAGDSTVAAQILAGPVLESRLVQDLILRFIILFLFLQAWGLIDRLFGLISTGTAAGVLWVTGDDPSVTVYLPVALIQSVPSVAYWLILIGLGWPLFHDTSRLLGLELPSWLRGELQTRKLRVLRIVAVTVVVASAVAGPLLAVGFD